jgi:uncharacterized protein (DUF2384 family)
MVEIQEREERARLEEIDDLIESWIATLRGLETDYAENVDLAQIRLLVETAAKLAARLDEKLPPSLDPQASGEIRAIIIGAIRKIEVFGEKRPLDIIDDFVVRAESIRHIIRDVLNEDLSCDPSDAHTLAESLVHLLPRATKVELAKLTGVSERTFHRWLTSEAPAPRRLVLVTRIVKILTSAWSDEGVVAWFNRPRRELGSHAAIDVLDDPVMENDLLELARRGRAQHGV